MYINRTFLLWPAAVPYQGQLPFFHVVTRPSGPVLALRPPLALAFDIKRQRKFPQLELNLVAGIGDLGGGIELFLESTNVDESCEQVGAASFVVGTRGTGTTKGLLADDSAGALTIDVKVAGSIAQLILGEADGLTIGGKDGARETVLGGGVDELACLAKGAGGGIIVDVGRQDGTEEFSRQELVGGVGGLEDGWVDVVPLGGIVLATSDELEFLVGLGLVDGAGQLLEGGGVDDGTAKVGMVPGFADADLANLCGELLLEFGPEGLGDVETRCGTALLALELKSTPNGVLDGIVDFSRRVNQMEVLATSLADDSRVRSVTALSNTLTNGTVQLAKHGSAASVVESSELLVGEDGLGDLLRVTGDELDDVLGQTSLEEDLVDEPVGRNGKVAGLPHNDVAHQGRGARQVTGNGSEIEGAHGVNETLQRAILETVPQTRRVVLGLLGEKLLRVVNVEAEEVCQLGGGVNLGLPCVFTLAEDGRGHDLIPVLVGDEVGSLEEDGRTVGEGQSLPGGLGGQSSLDGPVDIGGSGSVIVGHLAGVIGGV